jgi:hypothetical protein
MSLDITRGTLLSNVTVTNGNSTVLGDTTAVDGSAAIAIGIEAQMVFNAAATAGATLKIFTSADGTNYTTSPVQEVDIATSSATTNIRIATTVLTGHKYYKPQLTNGSGQDITGIYLYSEPQVLS